MHANDDLAKLALDYHAHPTPGKISVMPSKPLLQIKMIFLGLFAGGLYAWLNIHADGEDAAAKYTLPLQPR